MKDKQITLCPEHEQERRRLMEALFFFAAQHNISFMEARVNNVELGRKFMMTIRIDEVTG